MTDALQDIKTYQVLPNGFILFEDENKFWLGIILGTRVDDRMELDKGTYNFILRREGKTVCQAR